MPYDFVVVITNAKRFCGHFEFLKLKVLYIQFEICHQHLCPNYKESWHCECYTRRQSQFIQNKHIKLNFLIFFVKSPVKSLLGMLLTHTPSSGLLLLLTIQTSNYIQFTVTLLLNFKKTNVYSSGLLEKMNNKVKVWPFIVPLASSWCQHKHT
jgi:hypothetical protein